MTTAPKLTRRRGAGTTPTPVALCPCLGQGRRVYLKCDCLLPFGTHKTRAARAITAYAQTSVYRELTAGSCGNYGVALAALSQQASIRCVIFVPKAYKGGRVESISSHRAVVRLVDGSYESAVAASREYARDSGALDANPGGPCDGLFSTAFGDVVREVRRQITAPVTDYWIPVGNGTTAAGIFHASRELQPAPRIHIVGSTNNTAAVYGVQAGKAVVLDPSALNPTIVNEPLVNWNSLHATSVIEAVTESKGSAITASDDELLSAAALIGRLLGINVSPSGAAGLAGLLSASTSPASTGCHTVLLTAMR